ncbi:MAG: hypothetical protein WCD66_05930 [Rhodanobacteraceae bacterium]
MRYTFLLLTAVLSGCASTGNLRRDYGVKYPEGQVLVTSCVSVRSFDELLRSSPKLYGDDSFVGYIDYGPGMPRGSVFLVIPLNSEPESLGDLLVQADPKHHKFWLEAKLLKGQIAPDKVFEAIVPPLQHSPGPHETIIEREAILVRGQVHGACGKQYLVAAQANPMVSESREWPILRKRYDQFISSLQWPP